MMKPITYAILLLSLLASCQEYLDIKPYGETIPKTPEEYEALLHTHLATIDQGDDALLIGNSATSITRDLWMDDFESSLAPQTNLPLHIKSTLEVSNSLLPYEKYYEIIRNCNIIIGGMPDNNTPLAHKVLATAYAMRGVSYYQLMRLYCEAPNADRLTTQLGVPLVLHFDMEARTDRSTLKALIESIELDLSKSISYGMTDNDYIFTADVAKGYLARLYFWSENWQPALEVATELLKKYPLLRGDEYLAMFGSDVAKGNSIVRNPHPINPETTSLLNSMEKAPLSVRYTSLFTKEEHATDIRYKSFVTSKRYATKGMFTGMRAAEMQLIAAEASYHLGQHSEALALINALRAHRIEGYQPLTMETLTAANQLEYIQTDATGATLTHLMALILAERRREMLLEGDRFFELKRCGSPSFWKGISGRRYDMHSFMYTMPLPLKDLALQPTLVQNPQYDQYTKGR